MALSFARGPPAGFERADQRCRRKISEPHQAPRVCRAHQRSSGVKPETRLDPCAGAGLAWWCEGAHRLWSGAERDSKG